MKQLLLSLFIVLSLKSQAQQTPEQLLNNFFKSFADDKVEALKALYFTNVWFKNNPSALDELLSQIKLLDEKLGKYNGYELIQTRKVTNSYALYSYFIKYDLQPIRFNFVLYKPNDQWLLQGFKFDDQLSTELFESSNIIYTNN